MASNLSAPLNPAVPTDQDQKKSNLRLALALASLAGIFLAGFVIKITWFQG